MSTKALAERKAQITRLSDWQPPAATYGLAHVGNPEVPTLSRIGQAKGKEWLAAQLATELERFAESMGFTKRMSGTAITQMAIRFVRQHGQYTYQDFQLFLHGASMGDYGKFVYGNTAELMEMWNGYLTQRIAHATAQADRRREAVDQDQDQVAEEVQKIHKGYRRVRRESIEKRRAKREKKLKWKCQDDARKLWHEAFEYAKGKGFDEAAFIQSLSRTDIADALFVVRQ